MAGRDLTVIKLGGSHAFAPHLFPWIEAIGAYRGQIVIVPGGGPFADAVRGAQPMMGFNDRAAHRMALLAMEQYACALASYSQRFVLADSHDAINRAFEAEQVPVWLPSGMALAADEIPWSWDVTSDSLAAWLAGKLGASRLLLIKHIKASVEAARASDLAAHGVVDRFFPQFMQESGVPAFMLGAADDAALADIARGEWVPRMRIDPC